MSEVKRVKSTAAKVSVKKARSEPEGNLYHTRDVFILRRGGIVVHLQLVLTIPSHLLGIFFDAHKTIEKLKQSYLHQSTLSLFAFGVTISTAKTTITI